MNGLLDFGIQFLQGILLLVLAPGLLGLLRYLRTSMQGRRRPITNLLQPYRDLIRLARQPAVRAQTGSWLFRLAPPVLLAAYGTLAFAMPAFGRPPLLRVDLITVIYLLGLARFTFSLAGLDAGAPFGGLGGSREMFLHFQTEIGLAVMLVALVLDWNTLDLQAMVLKHAALGPGLLLRPDLLLLAAALAVLILFETGRIPIDNPATHLELTMGHKAIALEYAGRDLALIEWAEAIKLTALLTLFTGLFLPFSMRSIFQFPVGVSGGLDFLVKLVICIITVALWETTRPKLRLRKVVGLSLLAATLGLIAVLYIVVVHPGS